MNKYKATTFVRTLYVWWKTYRADKDWIIVADSPEVEKMCKAYNFTCLDEPAVKKVEPKKEEPITEEVIVDEKKVKA